MVQSSFSELVFPAIEEQLYSDLKKRLESGFPELREAIFYHFGFTDTKRSRKGKRIRPLLVLLTADLLSLDWQKMLPAASAVEILHNFSLIHDDIEDHSSLRRGKKTIWKKWGIEKALNIGDMLFILSVQTMQSTETSFGPEKSQQAIRKLMQAAYSIMQGQQMDMAFEGKADLPVGSYLHMIENKTAALLAHSCEISAVLNSNNREVCENLFAFGLNLGMAFQIYDDWLGIWGSEEQTGKTECSDLIEKKLSYPVLLGLQQNKEFSKFWRVADRNLPSDVLLLKKILNESKIEERVLKKAAYYNEIALNALECVKGKESTKAELRSITENLIKRNN